MTAGRKVGKIAHVSVRARYRILSFFALFAFIYFVSPKDSHFPSLAGASARWRKSSQAPAALVGDHHHHHQQLIIPQQALEDDFFTWHDDDWIPPPKPKYKPAREKTIPLKDPFPLLSKLDPNSQETRRLLRGPHGDSHDHAHQGQQQQQQRFRYNPHKQQHQPPRPKQLKTPLMIGFTRNWPQLLQCVVSYIAAGWPPEDIYVVENTGTMDANRDGLLTLQNPFYLNHTQLGMLGVSVIVVSFPLLPSPFRH